MTIELTTDQALVLFDLLSDYEDGRTLPIRHAAERNALWSLEGQLEKQLAEPFRADYAIRLQDARRRIEEQNGSWDG